MMARAMRVRGRGIIDSSALAKPNCYLTELTPSPRTPLQPTPTKPFACPSIGLLHLTYCQGRIMRSSTFRRTGAEVTCCCLLTILDLVQLGLLAWGAGSGWEQHTAGEYYC